MLLVKFSFGSPSTHNFRIVFRFCLMICCASHQIRTVQVCHVIIFKQRLDLVFWWFTAEILNASKRIEDLDKNIKSILPVNLASKVLICNAFSSRSSAI